MVRNSDPSSARILELSEELFACETLDRAGEQMLAPLAPLLNAESVAMMEYRWAGDNSYVDHSSAHAVDPHYHHLYNTRYFRQDPVVDKARPTNIYYDRCAGGQLEIFALSDISDYRELERTEYYNEFFRPICVHHVLALCFRSRHAPDHVIGVGFHRPSHAPAFDHRDMRRARQIAAPLMTKAQSLMLAAENERRGAVMGGLAGISENQGVLILDDSNRLLFANDRVRTDLHLNEVVGQQIDAGTRSGMGQLMTRCKSLPRPGGTRVGEPKVNLTMEPAPGAPTLKVSAEALTGTARQVRYLITTQAEEANLPFARSLDALGLTRREADIVSLLVKGLSNPEIGEELIISVRTVENHLRSIYGKAGVQSRTQLIGRLISGS